MKIRLGPLAAVPLLVIGPLGTAAVHAQPVAPGAGEVLEQMRPPVQPLPSPTEPILPPGTEETPTPAGGPQVTVQRITLEGMSRFDGATLQEVLGDYRGRRFDLAGLRGLAARITAHYRARGYPFAVAYLPPQTVKGGEVTIRVVEGRYGKVRASGDPGLAAGAAPFLAPLHAGEVIEAAPLERAVHLLGDQPGVVIAPLLTPGAAVGSGDLDVRLTPGQRFTGDLGLDNHGNRYTGARRLSASLAANRLLRFGDRLTLGAVFTEQRLWYGRLGYSLPWGGSGLRPRVEFLKTAYELGEEFAPLGATGEVSAATVGLDYPLLRTRGANLVLRTDLAHRAIEERPNATAPVNDKSSDRLGVALHFDRRDTWAGGGVTWGELAWSRGQLALDASLARVDRLTARSEGDYRKLTLDLARVQRLPGAFSLYGRLAAQWSGDNLDSSEDFGLGGPNGVRAYPRGEGFGDRGWLTQWELRYQAGGFSPYLFHDHGEVEINAVPWSTGVNRRRLGGAGAGLRFSDGGWSLDLAAAWRTIGGAPRADIDDDRPRLWLTARYRF